MGGGHIGPEKTCLPRFANNKGTDQPAHPRSLISAFVIRFLESTIYNLATSEILIFQLVSVADETGLSLALSETPKTGFLVARLICFFLKTPFFVLIFFSLLEMTQKTVELSWNPEVECLNPERRNQSLYTL